MTTCLRPQARQLAFALAAVAAIADLALSAGPGFFITGTNGYDSRVSAVPEPGAWALLLAGMAVLSLRARAARGRERADIGGTARAQSLQIEE